MVPTLPAPVLSAIVAACFAADLSFARDEMRAERVLADDDPITLPISVMPAASTLIWEPPRDLDPDTTGSVSSPSKQPVCTRVSWFPERAAEDQFRPKC